MIGSSELIINPDGTVFHLHLKPEHLADNIILVGDPGRVELIASLFSTIEVKTANREFVSVTGQYRGIGFTVLSTGIGTDNIDIVLNELDALANIDFVTREVRAEKRSLNIVRIGTSGGLQPYLDVNSFVVSEKAIGFDGLLNFYANRDSVSDLAFEKQLKSHLNWNRQLASPYVVSSSSKLFDKFQTNDFTPGVTISAPGFYGPQGRVLRLPLADPQINAKIEDFSYQGAKITNYEMECSAIYGLSALLGHHALTVCLIIANRLSKQANGDYHSSMKKLIRLVLDKLAE
ncbi:nucleoside phosphorylase [Mangrovibacterium marinum]|uniref:Uridine phosphorylase n=1 Tax=Mangrovibacterium marinum TaxID=1639118 RepID=A0A2T5BXK3_9BACT|nr:nucleoside phosphorylase [Mangrovibacterium marinum]PTN05595.1 uridine phosphorylase [Mangrovibacterium marinum]